MENIDRGFPSTHTYLDFFPHMLYELKEGPHPNNSFTTNLLGCIVVPLSAVLTPITIVADIVIALFESILIYLIYDFTAVRYHMWKKCVAGASLQLVLMVNKVVGFFFSPLNWTKVYESSVGGILKLTANREDKAANILFDKGHRHIYEQADLRHPDVPDPATFTYNPPPKDRFFEAFFGPNGFFSTGKLPEGMGFDFVAPDESALAKCINDVIAVPDEQLATGYKEKYVDFRKLIRTKPTASEILGFKPREEITVDSLKNLYRKGSLIVHPDRNPDHQEESKRLFQCLQVAMTELTRQAV